MLLLIPNYHYFVLNLFLDFKFLSQTHGLICGWSCVKPGFRLNDSGGSLPTMIIWLIYGRKKNKNIHWYSLQETVLNWKVGECSYLWFGVKYTTELLQVSLDMHSRIMTLKNLSLRLIFVAVQTDQVRNMLCKIWNALVISQFLQMKKNVEFVILHKWMRKFFTNEN